MKYQENDDTFIKKLILTFYDLLKSQEDLGDEFKEVLYDNLWDLYQE